MTAPVNAVALFRTVLANLDDETPRLVFADWLEDTGDPHNIAWAEYIRINTLEQGTFRKPYQRDAFASDVRARLTISAGDFVLHCGLFTRLLPPSNITLRLSAYTPPPLLATIVPESVARENFIAPLIITLDSLYFASLNNMTDKRLKMCQNILDREIVLVRGYDDEIRECLNRTFGGPETETVDY